MPNRNFKAKNITVNKHKFRLEIYNTLVDWEIFPHTYDGALYAFSNKNKLNKLINLDLNISGISEKLKVFNAYTPYILTRANWK